MADKQCSGVAGKDSAKSSTSKSRKHESKQTPSSADSNNNDKTNPVSDCSTSATGLQMQTIINCLKSVQETQATFLKRLTDVEQKTSDYSYDESYEEFDPTVYLDEEEYEPPEKRMREDSTAESSAASNSRFAALANKFKSEEIVADSIDPILAKSVTDMFRKGMPEELYDKMTKDDACPRPSNCDGLVVVKLDKLIWDVVSPQGRNNDKKMQAIEKSIVKAGVCLTKTMEGIAKLETDCKNSDKNIDMSSILDGCNDALALLGQANLQVNMTRRDFLKPDLRDEYKHLCNHSLPFTDCLFGDDVSKTAREIEECNKMGTRMQFAYPVRARRGRFLLRNRYPVGRRPFGQSLGRGIGSNMASSKNFHRRGAARK